MASLTAKVTITKRITVVVSTTTRTKMTQRMMRKKRRKRKKRPAAKRKILNETGSTWPSMIASGMIEDSILHTPSISTWPPTRKLQSQASLLLLPLARQTPRRLNRSRMTMKKVAKMRRISTVTASSQDEGTEGAVGSKVAEEAKVVDVDAESLDAAKLAKGGETMDAVVVADSGADAADEVLLASHILCQPTHRISLSLSSSQLTSPRTQPVVKPPLSNNSSNNLSNSNSSNSPNTTDTALRPRLAVHAAKSSNPNKKSSNSQEVASASSKAVDSSRGEEGSKSILWPTRSPSPRRKQMLRMTSPAPSSSRSTKKAARSHSRSGAATDKLKSARVARSARISGTRIARPASWSLSAMCAHRSALTA